MQRVRADRRKIIVLIAVSLAVVGVILLMDLLTKSHFQKVYRERGDFTQWVIPNFFYFTYKENTGAAFSFLDNLPWAQLFFKILTAVALLCFIYFLIYSVIKGRSMMAVAMSFLIGGTLGNFIDRLMMSKVRDFIGFKFGSYYFPIFNVADSFLTVGAILLVIYCLFFSGWIIKKKKVEGNQANSEEQDKPSDKAKKND